MKHNEFKLQQSICAYLNAQYPKILYFSDTIANVKLNVIQASRNKSIQKHGFKLTDLVILEPNKRFKGLFIELKIKSPYKKNGELLANKHLQGQQKSIEDLKARGYYATFAVGYEDTIKIIDAYLKDR